MDPTIAEHRRRRLWDAFAQGRWRRGSEWQPELPGTYYCAALDGGRIRLIEHYTEQKHCTVVRRDGLGAWRGWIWSEPLPPAPVTELPESEV